MQVGGQVTAPLILPTDRLCCLVRAHLSRLDLDGNTVARPMQVQTLHQKFVQTLH